MNKGKESSIVEEHLTIPEGLIEKSTFTFSRKNKEVFRITPDGEVIVQGDVYEAAKFFWDVVQQLAPKGWRVKVGVVKPCGQTIVGEEEDGE